MYYMSVKVEMLRAVTVVAFQWALLSGCGSNPEPIPTKVPLVIQPSPTPTQIIFPSAIPPIPTTDIPTLTPDRDNSDVGQQIETHFQMELKDHLFLRSGLEIFLYSEPQTLLRLNPEALETALRGRLNYLDAVENTRYKTVFEKVKQSFETNGLHGYSLHLVIPGNPMSCLIPDDRSKNDITSFHIYTYSDLETKKACDEEYIADTINLPERYIDPQTNTTLTRGPIGVIMLTKFADALGWLHHQESIVKLDVDLPPDQIDAFNIGHEFLHFAVGAFDPNNILNRFSEERSVQQLDNAYYQDFTSQQSQPIFHH